MYFNFLPSIKYDLKPINYPFSESDYVVAKNFFRRYKISDTAFNSTVFYNKYAIQDGQRLEQLSEAAYGSPQYDWVIALTNNMINTAFDMPLSESELRKHIESRYSNPYYDTHHYEIISDDEQIEKFGKVLIPGGTWVDESFYNDKRTLVNDTFPDLSTKIKTYSSERGYVFSTSGFDNNIVEDLFVANFDSHGSGGFYQEYLGYQVPDPTREGSFVFRGILPEGTPTSKSKPNGYLRFIGVNVDENNEVDAVDGRYVTFKPIDTTNASKFTVYGEFGTDINGGEYPGTALSYTEDPQPQNSALMLYYRNDPRDPWQFIDIIIRVGVLQGFTYDGSPQPSTGFGGPGRIPGVYTDVALRTYPEFYETNIKVTVTVEENGFISSIIPTDRGYGNNNVTLAIRNSDIGNGFYFSDVGTPLYLPNVLIIPSFRSDENGFQYDRFDAFGTEPFKFSLPIPESAKSPSTEFKLLQPYYTNVPWRPDLNLYDQYAIQAISIDRSVTEIKPTEIDYTKIDDDNYIIEGVKWTRDNGAWYRVIQTGYRYYDDGSTLEISGSELARPVTEFEYEQRENEKKREIYILKPNYLSSLVDDFRKASLYKKSSDYVSNRLKQTGV